MLTWKHSPVHEDYNKIYVPSIVKQNIDNPELSNWFYTTFINHISTYRFKVNPNFFAEYPIPDQLQLILKAKTLLMSRDKDGFVNCVL